MIFQVIDDKKECLGYFSNGKLRFRKPNDTLTATWDWSSHIGDLDVQLARIYADGKSIADACPDHLKTRWQTHERRVKAHIRSFIHSGVKMEDICFYDLVPERHVAHYYETLNEITEWVLENYERPQHYRLMHDTTVMCKEIGQQEVRINWPLLKEHAKTDNKAFHIAKRYWEQKVFVKYNPYGTVTGRLGLEEGSFPILNFKKEIRDVIVPKWDGFVELDFNGAELRTLLHLSGHPQPTGDIHDFNQTNIFNDNISRDDAKTKIFAWLYNPTSKAVDTEYYDKSKVLERYYNDGVVTTPFGRAIPSDDFHALNYLIQSTSSDNFLDRANAIHRFCRNLKTNVAFLVHDSIILDVHASERDEIRKLIEIFSDTKLGEFKVNVSMGKTLGSMQKVQG